MSVISKESRGHNNALWCFISKTFIKYGHVRHEIRYYWRRFSRIAPSLYSMLALVYLLVLPAMRANLLSDDARYASLHRV